MQDAGTEDFLAVLHFFSNDRNAMELQKKTVGGKRFLREWLDGSISSSIIKPASEVNQLFVEKIVQELTRGQAPLMRIWVGHDFGLIVIRELIFGGRFEEIPWISYLDGIVFEPAQGGSLSATWKGDSVLVTI